MTAQRIGVFTIDFPDPSAITYDNNRFNTLNESVSFQYRILGNIQTLSTKGVDSTDPYGILFVPNLASESCRSAEAALVPANATRLSNLPQGKNYALIAIAPWWDAQCTLEYFAAVRSLPTKGFLTYLPGQGNAKPPVLNDPVWNLSDGGGWQRANTFPTYALSSMTGGIIMDQLKRYSGNVSDAPHGAELAKVFDKTDYVRLWATVNTDTGSTLPNLWVFLVVVLAALLFTVAATSLSMHIIMRRRRNDLRHRVLTGEVDLEALGVKRLRIAQETLEKMPIYTYTTAPEPKESALPVIPPNRSSIDAETLRKTDPLAPLPPTTSSTAPPNTNHPSWTQPTCPICLDDFAPSATQVRELPCGHIYHPPCIDPFLLHNSSLCPLCKQSVLPAGACPVAITNLMVRRERHIRRIRERGERAREERGRGAGVGVGGDVGAGASVQRRRAAASLDAGAAEMVRMRARSFGALGNRIQGSSIGRRIFSAPESGPRRTADIEMAPAMNPPVPVAAGLPTLPPPTHAHALRPSFTSPNPPNPRDCSPPNLIEQTRQRALTLLRSPSHPASGATVTTAAAVTVPSTTGPSSQDFDELMREEEEVSTWRRGVRAVFPGFR